MSPVASFSSRILACLALAISLAWFLTGCVSRGSSTAQTPQAVQAPAAESPQQPYHLFRYPDEPPVLDAKGLQTFAASFRPRVVLLDFWASWSRQSSDEMADLVQMQEELGTEQFQVISCNLDAVEQWSAQTVPFLRAQRANFPCVVLRPEAKSGLRSWLAPNWSYDLPARFILDSHSRVVVRALSNVAVADVRDQARSAVKAAGGDREGAGLPPDGVALRVKLIDVRRGQSQFLPEVSAASPDPQGLAVRACQELASEIDRRLNARIAILPFPSSQNAAKAGTFGYKTAEQVQQELRRQGYYDLVGPEQAEKMIASSGLTALAIDFDPARVKAKLNCDYLIVGWLRGDTRGERERAAAAKDGTRAPEGRPAVAEQGESRE